MQSLHVLVAFACLALAAAQGAEEAAKLQPPLVMDIEWQLQGNHISFTGFFCELLGLSSGLLKWFPEMRVGKSSWLKSANEPHFGGKEPTLRKIKDMFDIDLMPEEARTLKALAYPSQPAFTPALSQKASAAAEVEVEPAGSAAASGTGSCLASAKVEHDTIYRLGDLSKRYVPGAHVSAEACCQACAAHRLCVGFTHGPEYVGEFSSLIGPAGQHLLKCSLKGSLPAPDAEEAARPGARKFSAAAPNAITRVHYSGFTSGVLPRKRPAPRAVIFHGTMCLYRNESVHTYARDTNTIYVGRYMVERSAFPSGFSQDEYLVFSCAARMDEVWVPTEWHRRVFVDTMRSMGIPSSGQVVVVPEAVDTELFAPAAVRSRAQGNRFSTPNRAPQSGCRAAAAGGAGGRPRVDCPRVGEGSESRGRFRFLSVFKWEKRKGWDVLLHAYWSAFHKDDDVVLELRTYVPSFTAHIDPNITQHLEDFAQQQFHVPHTQLAPVVWSSDVITRADVRDLLATADAFVLPTRGEGWGLPVAEAMAMQVPTIVTNHSGPQAYATEDNAYLIPVLPQLDSAAYAQPDGHALQRLLWEAVHDSGPEGGGRAQLKGARARSAMQRLSPDSVAALMAARLRKEAERRGWQF